jgi:hypothetical protein
MTFSQFVLTRQARENPRGDFIRDAKQDRNFPLNADFTAVRNHVWVNGGCKQAMAECEALHKEYLRYISKEDK